MQKNRLTSFVLPGALCAAVFATLTAAAPAQAKPKKPHADAAAAPVKLEFYLDAYYAFDTDARQDSDSAPDQVTLTPRANRQLSAIAARRNEFNLNTAQATVSADFDWFRARSTFQFGTIANSSWAPVAYAPIQEANLGIRPLSNLGGKGNDLWIDGGLFLTHIGNESLLPRYNWLSTLSLVTMFEPFYQAGLRASYNIGDMLTLQLHLLNGYGIIEDNNLSKDFGWSIGYNTPLTGLSVAWNGQVGDIGNFDAAKKSDPGEILFYNNLNATYQVLPQLGFKGQFDFATKSGKFYYGGQLTGHYDFLERFGVSLRAETIQDPQGALTSAFDSSDDKTDQGLQGFGVTLGLEYRPLDNAFVRLEARELVLNPTHNNVFVDPNGTTTANRFEIAVNTGVWF